MTDSLSKSWPVWVTALLGMTSGAQHMAFCVATLFVPLLTTDGRHDIQERIIQ